MTHFIHYHRRIVTTPKTPTPQDLWYARQQASDAGFEAPVYHRTRARDGPATRVRPCDTIWLVSRLHSRRHGAGPLALDARIEVQAVRSLPAPEAGTRLTQFDAAPGSRWFPLFALNDTLCALRSVTASGAQDRPLVAKGDPAPGRAMQAMRELADPAPLRALEARIDRAPLHFISYRVADGTWPAFAEVRQRATGDVAIWWDRWCLPRRLAERREFLDDARLQTTIENAIRRSSVVWGIETALYGQSGSYTATERCQAMRAGLYRPVTPEVPLS